MTSDDAALQAESLVPIMDALVTRWHEVRPALDWEAVITVFGVDLESHHGLVQHLTLVNCFQWHLEDECRAKYDDYHRLGELKHQIDDSNQRRVTIVAALDRHLASTIPRAESGGDTTLITPGELVDRISILLLKRWHVARSRATPPETAAKAAIIAEQISDSCIGYDALMAAIMGGQTRLKIYDALKVYGSG